MYMIVTMNELRISCEFNLYRFISSLRRILCSNHTFSRPKHLRTSVTCWQCKHVLAAFESKRTELSFCLGWSCHSVLSKRRVVGTAPMFWGKHGPFTNDYLLGAAPSILTWRVHKTSSHHFKIRKSSLNPPLWGAVGSVFHNPSAINLPIPSPTVHLDLHHWPGGHKSNTGEYMDYHGGIDRCDYHHWRIWSSFFKKDRKIYFLEMWWINYTINIMMYTVQ